MQKRVTINRAYLFGTNDTVPLLDRLEALTIRSIDKASGATSKHTLRDICRRDRAHHH